MTAKKNLIKEKSYAFALRIVKLSKHVSENHQEKVLTRQLLRSGTAIGALVRESEQAESKKDFIHKLSIALKEANETSYWLSILKDSDYISQAQFEHIHSDLTEILKLLTAIIKTMKAN